MRVIPIRFGGHVVATRRDTGGMARELRFHQTAQMTDQPWLDDACSLVDAFRAGERSPKEELQATLDAIEASDLNCFSYLDPERAFAAAESADLSKPFGGVPVGIKELEQVEGWPDTGASLVFKDRVAGHTSETVRRFLDDGGAVPVGLTTASEFGGLNVSVTKLNGVAHNPWQHGRTAGGSSGGSAVGGGRRPGEHRDAAVTAADRSASPPATAACSG